jgi:hypothetical protein
VSTITTTTTVEITDQLGRKVISISRTERVDVGSNPKFLLQEGMPAVLANAETALITAAHGLDRARSAEDGSK